MVRGRGELQAAKEGEFPLMEQRHKFTMGTN